MNGLDLRYEIYKALVGAVAGTNLVSPVPGEPLKIGVLTQDPFGKDRWFRVSIEEVDRPEQV